MKKIVLLFILLLNIFVIASCGDDATKEDKTTHSDEHTHQYLADFDKENHWLECECGDKKDVEVHTLMENEVKEVSICSKCSAVYTKENLYKNIKSIGVDKDKPHNAYQVLIYSYFDHNKDGYGDLAGLEEKLDYIKNLGCDIIWLSPIMESESYHAYDITSFYKIDSKIGSIDDYLSLVDKAHSMDMKIMLDMPINHTSNNHEWFLKYLEGDKDYREYYQEKNPNISYGTTSSMGNTARFYTDKATNKTYFAAFGQTMPDLNYQSKELQEAIYKVFDFWMGIGADGFRFDAVKHLFDPNEISSSEDSVKLNNNFFKELGNHLKEINPDVYLLGENFSGQNEVKMYAEAFDAEFDFDSWQKGLGAVTTKNAWGGNDGRVYFDDTIVGNTNELIDLNPNWIPTFMSGNHDVTRARSYIYDSYKDSSGNPTLSAEEELKALKLYAAMITLRSGIPFIYYGDEVGMYGENKTTTNKKILDSQIRLPMNFKNSTITLESVFTTVLEDGSILANNMKNDWPNFNETNPVVEEQIMDKNSIYNAYKELINYRTKNPIISLGEMQMHSDYAIQGSIISFRYKNEVVYVAFNYSEKKLEIKDLCSNGDLDIEFSVNGASSDGCNLTLESRGVAVFKTSKISQGRAEEDFNANYALKITSNDGLVRIVKLKPVDEFEGFAQHFADNVKLEAGDVIILVDLINNVEWNEDNLSKYGQYANFSSSPNYGVKCNKGGIYDFYVKFKYEADEIYIGNENGG